MERPDLVTFDVYSALLDIEGGLTARVARTLGLAEEKARPLVQLWRAKQMERAASSNSLGLGRISFRQATALGLAHALRRRELELDEPGRDRLVLAWDELDPWPEAERVLAEIKAREYPIALLSNGDQDMLETVARRFATPFDHILSSQTAGWYKPHPAVYALPTQLLGIAKEKVLHVAGGGNDVLGAVAFGLPCVWSNRSGDQLLDPDYPPLAEFSDLCGVLKLL